MLGSETLGSEAEGGRRVRVKRIYWWTDWLRGVCAALAELRRSLFGCHHDWDTVRFQHFVVANRPKVTAFWSINECRKCGRRHVRCTETGQEAAVDEA
jgi:hypothetical protein